jgi:Rrf2 family protein
MITREADYAIRCILYMCSMKEKLANVKVIAEPMGIPQSFLAKILQKLLKAGIVESIRGAGGGFRLRKKPSEINLYDVVVAIDGTMALNRCVDDPATCELSPDCVVHPIWVDVSKEMEGLIRTKDFEGLASKYSGKQ